MARVACRCARRNVHICRETCEVSQMLEPQGTAFFLILMVVFAGLLAWLVLAKQIVFRMLAACLAFIPAMTFGVAAVNKYYDYYQTWGSIAADFTNQGVATLPEVPHLAGKVGGGISKLGLSPQARAEATQTGYLFETVVRGRLSRISRTVYIYLPPQYFLAKYGTYRFPVIEMLHGSPGNPEQWVSPMNILPTLDDMIASRQADPAVLVMPDTDGGKKYALQCLNAAGIQDATYVAVDVPNFVAANYRVQPPGRAWGVAGLSEGGFCAANLALQYPDRFGYAGVISGYFVPVTDQVPSAKHPGAAAVPVVPFAGNPELRRKNTPSLYITQLPAGTLIPQFFLAAGQQDAPDVQAAESFRQEAQLYQANVPLVLIPNASHDANAWRGALRPMFSWMTPQLAHQAHFADAALAARERAQARARASKKPHGTATNPDPASTVPARR
jgi:poly(3-hydroxybutyrate) depolymerase